MKAGVDDAWFVQDDGTVNEASVSEPPIVYHGPLFVA